MMQRQRTLSNYFMPEANPMGDAFSLIDSEESSTGMRVINGLFAAFSLWKAKESKGASRAMWGLIGGINGYVAISGKKIF